jgi:hypothetical protein
MLGVVGFVWCWLVLAFVSVTIIYVLVENKLKLIYLLLFHLAFNVLQIQKCIGSAVFAMGPERFLIFVPISLDEHSYAYSNIWLVPILKQYITGASLSYYVEHIMPLAKSFKKASRKGMFQHLEHLYLSIT